MLNLWIRLSIETIPNSMFGAQHGQKCLWPNFGGEFVSGLPSQEAVPRLEAPISAGILPIKSIF
jgi:hypothetical protein